MWLQVVEDGYEFFAQRKLITVFSAPNYCGSFDNAGALMSVSTDLMCSFQVTLTKPIAIYNRFLSVVIIRISKSHTFYMTQTD